MVDGIALAPPFEYLPTLSGPDPEHARLAAWVRAHRHELGDGALALELGEEGRTAAESARFFAARRARRILVVDLHSDPRGATALQVALRELGLEVVLASQHERWSRLADAPRASRHDAAPGAPWAARLGLVDAAGRDRLRARVASEPPALQAWVAAVLGFAELGLHPLAEVYAGNGLVERNAEYLVNLVPTGTTRSP